VPEEYLTNATIRDKLPNIKLNKLHEDVLFYLFYNCPGEVYQVAAASELCGFLGILHSKFAYSVTGMRVTGDSTKTSISGCRGRPSRHLPAKLGAPTSDASTTCLIRSSGGGFAFLK